MTPEIDAFANEHIQHSRLITCILPDDGIDRELMRTLRQEKGVEVADSVGCRGQFISKSSTKISNGRSMKLVEILVPEAEADSLFRFICEKSNIGRPNGGMISMGESISSTPYTLPKNLPDEIE